MNVTILGAGRMGAAMAARLVEQGHQVTLWDRDPIKAGAFADLGIAGGASIASAVEAAAVVITMVTDGEAVQAIAEQMLSAMPRSSVWVQASTVGAQWADRLRALAEGQGRLMLDAPVSGSTAPARSGTLSWLVAGSDDAIATARPALESLGERVIIAGAWQEASRLKLIVNSWMTAATVAMADALAAADHLGVPRSVLLDVIGEGPLAMPYATQKAQLMGRGDYAPGFPVELALKDIRLAETADGYQAPLVHAIEQRLQRAVDAGHARDDVAAVATVQ